LKLLRHGPIGREKPGVLDDKGQIRDLSGEVDDVFGPVLLPESLKRVKALNINGLPVVDGKPWIGACVGQVGKFICIGLNYSDHAAEAGMQVPREVGMGQHPPIFLTNGSRLRLGIDGLGEQNQLVVAENHSGDTAVKAHGTETRMVDRLYAKN